MVVATWKELSPCTDQDMPHWKLHFASSTMTGNNGITNFAMIGRRRTGEDIITYMPSIKDEFEGGSIDNEHSSLCVTLRRSTFLDLLLT